MKILADASLPDVSALFSQSFSLTLYQSEKEVPDLLPLHDILLCRSTLKVTAKLLAKSPLLCVATASSGTDHIDCDYLKTRDITLFDAKGCNARAVADYVIATIAYLQKNTQLLGNKAGVIGVGEVGSRVVKRLHAAGFDVLCFDPLKAGLDNNYRYCSLKEIASCDLICIHCNLHTNQPHPSVDLISTDFLGQLKPGTAIINAARGGIVNEAALLKTELPIIYCTDVYSNEPSINEKIVNFATLCTPHIAGHSIEAKQGAVIQLSQQLHRYFGFPPPTKLAINGERLVLSNHESWQDLVLSLYNPITETLVLKAANDKKQAFLNTRQAHQYYHDFVYYDASQLSEQFKTVLGC